MRVLVSSTTGYGHVLPMVPLARALVGLGHEVLWATGSDVLPLVRSAGLAAAAAGMTEADIAPVELMHKASPVKTPATLLELLPDCIETLPYAWSPRLASAVELVRPQLRECTAINRCFSDLC